MCNKQYTKHGSVLTNVDGMSEENMREREPQKGNHECNAKHSGMNEWFTYSGLIYAHTVYELSENSL